MCIYISRDFVQQMNSWAIMYLTDVEMEMRGSRLQPQLHINYTIFYLAMKNLMRTAYAGKLHI